MDCASATSYGVICLYYLLSGVEYAVILPTLNLYLKDLNANQSFLGFVMASFSLTGLISAPIYGRFTDRTGSTKAAVLFSNLFEIGGNFLYFVAKSPYMVLGSRLIAGIGSGSGSSILGMISRNTTKERRTAVFSQLMSLRQLGLLIGPAFNVFLRKFNFYIGPFHVNQYTSPGLFMVVLWVIHEILVIFFYRELNFSKPENECQTTTDDEASLDENVVVNARSNSFSSYQSWRFVWRDLLKEEVVVCLAITFAVMFTQTGIETLLTPLTLKLFNWGELPNSIFFCIAGFIIIVSFLVLGKISQWIEDRQMLLGGFIVMVVMDSLFLIYIIFADNAEKGATWVLALFCVYCVIVIAALPFVWVPQAALYSKVTSDKTQALNQGIRLLVMGLGQILGPLWAAAWFQNLPVLAAVNAALVALILIMIIASYKMLKVPELKNDLVEDSMEPNERTSLLRNTSINAHA
ncbi:major facilitator superfamily domain-containing protein 8-like [Ciona intestinalis]